MKDGQIEDWRGERCVHGISLCVCVSNIHLESEGEEGGRLIMRESY